jgi:hypothetical protein
MKVSEITDEMLDNCSYIVIYSTSNDEQPFLTDDYDLDDESIPWVIHCDWTSDNGSGGGKWKSWQYGWSRDAKIVYSDVKDHIPMPHRFIAFRPFEPEEDKNIINMMITGWLGDEDQPVSKKNKLEGMLSNVIDHIDNDAKQQVYDDAVIINDYIFIRWD